MQIYYSQMFYRTKMKEILHGGGACVPSTHPPPPLPICEVVLVLNSLLSLLIACSQYTVANGIFWLETVHGPIRIFKTFVKFRIFSLPR